ncbi:hypothetical protein OKA04_02380 [Luteolibacter flavescens]|uniref:Uncharacterized protein n=1 Tax=Luteolibacter flavescens TaxID=1859460 RepID=A0ABT3FJ21_9BACT|nr:hypothetical protein [Luteolibacter flavescens]MCW1883556.1 hypothetical protein [Luteolibacter flavescens]
MTDRRPYYRWRSFWLGLFVVVSLVWIWSDSLRFASTVVLKDDYHAGNIGGGLLFERIGFSTRGIPIGYDMRRDEFTLLTEMTVSPMPPPLLMRGGEGDDSNRLPDYAKDALPTFHDALKSGMLGEPRHAWRVFIPHWLVMLGFVVPWVSFLAWRVSSRRRSV